LARLGEHTFANNRASLRLVHRCSHHPPNLRCRERIVSPGDAFIGQVKELAVED
jgi:hypothetical protein